ncbi:antibiotic biosynthesis monooxygenase [Pueribacillus theae]|uniref:Antibiotic biosynthesis monooxygenase n=1 Tax=Pueribacillus theae TaxID=2171751 RepID=A0A2U1K478_9BACI|nr:antibiotic biosynthesis monooxygenase family protein [Pueribacillus theae]PWA11783.1 antibiotic biosynthesis monooxygenase [Pueribacillus theae]
MNFFITYGTHDFLKSIYEKYQNKYDIYLLDGGGSSILIVEKEGKSLFQSGKTYAIEKASGSFERATFAVINNVPVTQEHKDIFLYEAKIRAEMIEKQPGCLAVRVLKPIKSDSFIILSMWDSSGDYRRFENSPEFGLTKPSTSGINVPQELFTGKAYVKTYSVFREELDNN